MKQIELPTELSPDEYLLKIHNNTGFLTKYNKNGTIPESFKTWHKDSEIKIHTEEFKKGWKFISYRIGVSQYWATLQHPNGFSVEIYLEDLMNIVDKYTIVKGEIIGEFKWSNKKLTSKYTDLDKDRIEKLKFIEKDYIEQYLTDEILKCDNQDFFDAWKNYMKLKI